MQVIQSFRLGKTTMTWSCCSQTSILAPDLCSTTRCHLLSTAATSAMSSAWGWLRTTLHNCMPVALQTAPFP